MKLLVISHACVTPVNQGFYADVARLTEWSVSLVIPSQWSNDYSSDIRTSRWKEFTGEIIALPVWKPGNIPLHLYKSNIARLLRRTKPDAIYVHHEPYGLATAQIVLANELGAKCALGFYGAQNIFKTYPRPFRWLEAWVLNKARFCFPVTEGALEILRRKGYRGAAQVLPLPIDKNVYHPEPVRAAEWRVKLGVGSEEFVVGYLGRLVEEKGLQTLLRALKNCKIGRRWSCVLAGSGPYEASLRLMVSELGLESKVIFLGFVPHFEAPALLSLFDVLVVPSETRQGWKEQFGRVIIEANACGIPVIGSDSGEISNVIRATGGGIIFPEADVHALSAAICEVAEDPDKARRLAEIGAASVSTKYDQEHLASLFASTIQQALK